jgi:hypothetical protein
MGALAMLLAAMRKSAVAGLGKSEALAVIRFTNSLFFSPLKTMKRHDC